jgi:hypothetical protein
MRLKSGAVFSLVVGFLFSPMECVGRVGKANSSRTNVCLLSYVKPLTGIFRGFRC